MPEFTVLLRGTPIATLHASFVDDFCGGDLVPLLAFEAIRATIADASRALANLGFLPPTGGFTGGVSEDGSRDGSASLDAAETLCRQLELRDVEGRVVHADWIQIFGGRAPDDAITLMARISRQPSGSRASVPVPPRHVTGREPEAD